MPQFKVLIKLPGDDQRLDQTLRRSRPELQASVIQPDSPEAAREIGWSLAVNVEARDNSEAAAQAEAAYRDVLADLGRPAPESVELAVLPR